MEKLEISQEQQEQHLISLSKSPGWAVLKWYINQAVEHSVNRLIGDSNVNLHETQSYIKALKFLLNKVEIKREENNADNR